MSQIERVLKINDEDLIEGKNLGNNCNPKRIEELIPTEKGTLMVLKEGRTNKPEYNLYLVTNAGEEYKRMSPIITGGEKYFELK